MPISSYLNEELLNHVYRGGTYTPPVEIWVGLHSSNPTGAGLGATELNGGSYGRQLCTFSEPDEQGYITNLDRLSFLSLPTVSAGVNYVSTWDAETSGNMLAYDDVSTISVQAGDALYYEVGNLRIRFKTSE